jgi:hypothetical protein
MGEVETNQTQIKKIERKIKEEDEETGFAGVADKTIE